MAFTRLALDDAIKLAVLVKDIPKEKIRNEVISDRMIVMDNMLVNGVNASIIRPIPDQIRILRDQLFTTNGPLSPMAQGESVDFDAGRCCPRPYLEWDIHTRTR